MAACITVFGGSGFLGREIVARLAAQGCHVRVAVRRPDGVTFPELSDEPARVTTLPTDIRNQESVRRALDGASAAINAVSLYDEQGDATFEAVHVDGAQQMALLAGEAGIERLVHLSGIGVDPRSSSSYVRARAAGERAVFDAFPDATILRPSVMFGPGDATITALAGIMRRSPILPLFGTGSTRLQPVYVGDVAAAAVIALDHPTTAGQMIELGGPDVLTYEALLRLLSSELGCKRLFLPLPFAAWRALATLLSPLPRPTITHHQITLMEQDNVVGPDTMTFANLGIEPTAMQEVLPSYLKSMSRSAYR